MAVNYKIYKSTRRGATMGKYYGRAIHRETVTTKDLAQTMQANCTVKHSDIIAVLTELSEVVKAELQRGNRVKIEGLGTFKIGITTEGAESAKEFTAANIKGSHIIFMPELSVDANGKRVKSLLSGLRVKEAENYVSLKDDVTGENNAEGDNLGV